MNITKIKKFTAEIRRPMLCFGMQNLLICHSLKYEKLNNQSKMTSICHMDKDLHYLYEYIKIIQKSPPVPGCIFWCFKT